jgi:hypothetical protein
MGMYYMFMPLTVQTQHWVWALALFLMQLTVYKVAIVCIGYNPPNITKMSNWGREFAENFLADISKRRHFKMQQFVDMLLSQLLLLTLPVAAWVIIPVVVPTLVLCILQVDLKYGDKLWCKRLVSLVQDHAVLHYLYTDELAYSDVKAACFKGAPAVVVGPLMLKWLCTLDGRRTAKSVEAAGYSFAVEALNREVRNAGSDLRL